MKKIYIIFKNDAIVEAYHNPTTAEQIRAAAAETSDGSIAQGIYHIKSVQVLDL